MKLKKLLADHGLTQTDLAQLLKRDKSVVTNLLRGRRRLKADEAAVIARAFGVAIDELLGMQPAQPGVAESCLIPFHHAPVQTRSNKQVVRKEGKYYLEETGYYSEKAYALEVHDDSMNLSGILPGDIIISELDTPCRAGQIVVAQHYEAGGAATVLRKYAPPLLLPHATNPAYLPLNLEADDVRLVSPVLKLVRLM